MPVFSFKAIDQAGASQAGQIEFTSRAAALASLQRQGLVPIALEEIQGERSISWIQRVRNAFLHKNGRLSAREILTLTQSLAALLNAGLTIDRALAMTASLSRGKSQATLIEIGREVRAGRTFAESLSQLNDELPPFFVGMVQAGELGGSLGMTMSRLAELLKRQHDVRERLRSAMIYPAILGVIVLVTIVLLLTVVLPRFEVLFAESEAELPLATRAVLSLGGFVSSYWWLLALAIGGVVASGIMFIRSPRGRSRVDRWLLKSRLVLGLPAMVDTARLLRTLSTLMGNGVQVASALRVAKRTLVNSRLREAVDEVTNRIKAGERTSAALAAVGVFPLQAVQLARVGEETGKMEELLLQAAIILEEESQLTLDRLLTLFVPLLTISMGIMIAGLIGSVLLGLLSINDLAF